MADLTGFADTDRWPESTRLIVRREPPLPWSAAFAAALRQIPLLGAQGPTAPTPPVVCDPRMRTHACVECTIERVKDTGGSRFPFTALHANSAWLQLSVLADTVVRWFQAFCLRGPLSRAKHKAMRRRLWHTPARIVRHARKRILQLPGNPKASQMILAARTRINLLI